MGASSSLGARQAAMAAVGLGLIEQTIGYAEFTDNTDTTGYKDLAEQLPPGALPIGWRCRVITGFSGDTTAVVQVGVSGDLDQYSADVTQSVLTSGTLVGALAIAADSGDDMNTGVTIRVTVTGGADFTSINAGSMTVSVWYFI